MQTGIARRDAAIHHGQAMIAFGLLSGPQASLILQGLLNSPQRLSNSLRYNLLVQDLLGMAKNQLEQVAQAGEAGRRERAQLNWFSVNRSPTKEAEFNAKVSTIEKENRVAAEGVLTPDQTAILRKLVSGQAPPVEPPDLHAVSESEAAKIDLRASSPAFRLLAEQKAELKVTDTQQDEIERLERIAKQAIFWIELGDALGPFPAGDSRSDPTEPIGKARARFVRHAEQVALVGILTQQQAARLNTLIKIR
jgi:hypothetical protein